MNDVELRPILPEKSVRSGSNKILSFIHKIIGVVSGAILLGAAFPIASFCQELAKEKNRARLEVFNQVLIFVLVFPDKFGSLAFFARAVA